MKTYAKPNVIKANPTRNTHQAILASRPATQGIDLNDMAQLRKVEATMEDVLHELGAEESGEPATADSTPAAEPDGFGSNGTNDEFDWDAHLQGAISGESAFDEDAIDDDGTLRAREQRPAPNLPNSRYNAIGKHRKVIGKAIGKYDEYYIANIRTRENLTAMLRNSGKFSDNEISSAVENRESRVRFLVANGYIAMRADECKRELEKGVMKLIASVGFDANKAADIDMPVKERKAHLDLLKQSIELLKPVIEMIKDREDHPEDSAKPVRGIVDLDC